MKRTKARKLALLMACALLPALSACGAATELTPTANATATVAASDTAPGAIVTMTATARAVETPTEAAMMSPTAGEAGGAAGSPADVVQAFYGWYVRFSGNPFTSGAPEMAQYVTPEMVARLANPAKGTPGLAVDPFVCAQNPPVSFTVGNPTISGDHATVVVQTQYGSDANNDITVSLVQRGGTWQIDNVTCAPPQ